MEEQNILIKSFLDFLETFISLVTTGEITDLIIKAVGVLFVLLWMYCGVKLFIDARQRYKLNLFLQVLILLLGLVTGPIGFLFYIFTRPKYTKEEVDFLATEHKFYFQQASKVVDCIKCGKYLPEGHEFCTNCGEQNRLRCPNCNNLTNLEDKFCFYCGFKFEEDRRDKHVKALAIHNIPKIQNEVEAPLLHNDDEEKAFKTRLTGLISFRDSVRDSFKGLSDKALLNLNLRSRVEDIVTDNYDETSVIIETKQEDEIIEEGSNSTKKVPKRKKGKKGTGQHKTNNKVKK